MTSVLFDLDGTLIDSMPQIHKIVSEVLEIEGLPPVDRPRLQTYVGSGLPALVTRLLGGLGHGEDPALSKRVTDEILARYTGSHGLTRLYPGVRSALEALAASGHRLGIVTNKPEEPARSVVAHFGLADMFGVLIGGDSLPERKPHPRPLLDAIAALGGPAVYVGDSEVDAETAKTAGAPFALYTPGYRKSPVSAIAHQAEFDDFAALPGIVDRLLIPAG